jgi:drug/metabolite transporter (DMT)-like permease
LGGLFACLFKKWVNVEQNSGIVFGLFSVVAVIIGIPTIVICHFTGIQEFQVPDWRAALLTVADALLCSVVGNYFYAKCYVYLSPITVAMGLTLTIPVSFVITAGILKTHIYPYQAIIGVALIFIAVVLVSWDQAKYEKTLSQRNQVNSKEEPADNLSDGQVSLQTSI